MAEAELKTSSLIGSFEVSGADTQADLGQIEATLNEARIAGKNVTGLMDDLNKTLEVMIEANDGRMPSDLLVTVNRDEIVVGPKAGRLEDYPEHLRDQIIKRGLDIDDDNSIRIPTAEP